MALPCRMMALGYDPVQGVARSLRALSEPPNTTLSLSSAADSPIPSTAPCPAHSNETGQEVCEDVVRQQPSGEDKLLGLVITGKLQG